MTIHIPQSEAIINLKKAVDRLEVDEANGKEPIIPSAKVVLWGIDDLDFDGYYFLKTGITSPDVKQHDKP